MLQCGCELVLFVSRLILAFSTRPNSIRQVSLRVASRTLLSGTVPCRIDCWFYSDPHLLEAAEISRQINIDGEIGLMKVAVAPFKR
jgi:hypothetical protein